MSQGRSSASSRFSKRIRSTATLWTKDGRNLISYFQSKGYFDVKIETHFEQQADMVTVTYQVDRGVRHRVEHVEFEGNHYFSDRRLGAAVAVKKGRSIFGYTFSRGYFSDQLLQKSTDAVTALYKDAGFRWYREPSSEGFRASRGRGFQNFRRGTGQSCERSNGGESARIVEGIGRRTR